MNNKHVKVKVERNLKENTIEVSAQIPEMNPRKGINYIRYDSTNAYQDAYEKYGDLVGAHRSDLPCPVLDNKNRPIGNVLEGVWVFESLLNLKEIPATTKKTSRRRTRTKTTKQSI